jgi:hypothetical protein
MDEVAVPTYEVLDDVHRFAFPDGTSLVIRGLQRDRAGRFWATVEANAGEDALVNCARIDLLNLQDRQRFYATMTGDGSTDWQARLVYAVAQLDAGRATLTGDITWDPPVPFDEFDLPPFPTEARRIGRETSSRPRPGPPRPHPILPPCCRCHASQCAVRKSSKSS